MTLNQCEGFHTTGRCPGYKFHTCTTFEDDPRTGHTTLDLCLFGEDHHVSATQTGRDHGFILGCAELFVQTKSTSREDPFLDPEDGADLRSHNFVKEEEEADDDDEEIEEEEDREEDNGDNHEGIIRRNLGEIAISAAELCARQHRTHCFSISIYGTTARLFRWDRAGVIVTRSFDLLEKPEILCLFVWRYSRATDVQRGYDTTVSKATHEEEMKFKAVVMTHIKQQLSLPDDRVHELIREHYKPNAVFKLPIYPVIPQEQVRPDNEPGNSDETGRISYAWDKLRKEHDEACGEGSKQTTLDRTRMTGSSEAGIETQEKSRSSERPLSKCRKYSNIQYFLVSTPVAMPLTAANRGTRGYWAVKIPDPILGERDYEIAFLKDTWADNSPGFEIEGEIMVELVESGVKFVSDIFCHGNVPDNEGKATSVEKLDGSGASQCVGRRTLSLSH